MERSDPQIILYPGRTGRPDFALRVEGGTVWLTQAETAELFQTTTPNINIHIRNILKERELDSDSVVKESLITAADGKNYRTKLYRLEMILAVGYRVRSARGTEFRQWATAHLSEYLVKGFVMNDERLKHPEGGWDYFDELLARIREIRASEQRFYQKVRDLLALSRDYKDDPAESARFFAEIQNKMLFAVTRHTAAELVVQRADPSQPNMNLMTWSGSRVRKHDILVAKNYLNADEVDTLNRLTVIFLEQAELRVKSGKPLDLDYWRSNVDRMLEFNERPVLQGPGRMSHSRMKEIVSERYEEFDGRRREAERLAADAEDVKALESLAKEIEAVKPMKKQSKPSAAQAGEEVGG
jgi:hypothetical protein